jgi:serine/threonine protein kinase
MSFAPGARLGAYEVLTHIGAGGMGQVYRARDTKLNREVALKILPDLFALDPDRLARFKREAQVLASLNHPNIGGIYGFEESNSVQALVLELVEGPTLADHIAQGPIPLDEALPVARQIAEALEAAHEQGIIHRDLKPANIKLRPDGTVKVLDFGLAKALTPEPATMGIGDMSQSPTITSPAMTRMGVILGTAAYMSPEQARGKAVDKRSDIWAFGCVLYEMLTGTLAFAGNDVSGTLACVLMKEPDWEALPRITPPGIRRLLKRCLEKDLKRRLHDSADARIEIEEVLGEAVRPAVVPAKPVTAAPRNRERFAWTLTGIFLLVAVVSVPLALVHFREPVAENRAIRFVMLSPEKATVLGTPPTVSPDGRRVAFVAISDGKALLWVRSLDSVTSCFLCGAERSKALMWDRWTRGIAGCW